jgi:hypothetical protein
VVRNFSRRSVQRIELSSRDLRREGRSEKEVAELAGVVAVRGMVCKYPIAETLLSLFLSAAKAEDWGRSMSSP